MIIRLLPFVFAVAVVFQMPPSVQAFECPGHFKDAQATIDKASKALRSLKKRLPALQDRACLNRRR